MAKELYCRLKEMKGTEQSNAMHDLGFDLESAKKECLWWRLEQIMKIKYRLGYTADVINEWGL